MRDFEKIAHKIRLQFRLYFVRSGQIHISAGYQRFTGYVGDYWSSSGKETTNAYYLSFSALGDVIPSTGPHNRWTGFSLRCLQE